MPSREAPIYRPGEYWLDKFRRDDGSARSPRWYVFWYDPDARREASASTSTEEAYEAIVALDRRYLADKSDGPASCDDLRAPGALRRSRSIRSSSPEAEMTG